MVTTTCGFFARKPLERPGRLAAPQTRVPSIPKRDELG